MNRAAFLPLFLACLSGCAGAEPSGAGGGGASGEGTVAKLDALGAKPCALDASYLCVSIPVPLDHAAPAGKNIDVTFAVHPAPAATRRGMLVTADGGPGYAGTDDLYRWKKIDPRFEREFDTVYFDLRGVKTSGDLGCPNAAAAFYLAGLRVADARDESVITDKSRTFAADCVAEMGIPVDEVPFYATDQAVEDLEAFRAAFGDEQLSLYGFSYGTQFMQTYAAKHGAHVRVLMLDGTIDLTLDHEAYMTDLNQAVTGILDAALDDCAGRSSCAAHFAGADGAAAPDRVRAGFDAVAATLEAAPKVLAFPLAAGGTSKRIFSRADLDTTTFNAMYDPGGRRDFLGALASAFEHDDYLPLLRVSYSSAGIDAETAGEIGTASADPGLSDAIYYAFTCNDYGADAATTAARQDRYLAAGRQLWSDPRVLSPYYGDDPCAFWPVTRRSAPVAPSPLTGIPTMVIGATADAAVPHDQGESVAARLADGYLIEITGEHHVMYGVGQSCIDTPGSAFLLDLERPSSRSIHCAGQLVAP